MPRKTTLQPSPGFGGEMAALDKGNALEVEVWVTNLMPGDELGDVGWTITIRAERPGRYRVAFEARSGRTELQRSYVEHHDKAGVAALHRKIEGAPERARYFVTMP